jgi:carotenoid cleavage dioxygenase
VKEELWVENLKVTGKIPEELNGAFMRNGSNPQFEPLTYTYPFDGDGMIHAVYLQNGKASYRNRYVLTKELLAERRAGKALYGGIAKPIFPDHHYLEKGDNTGPVKAGCFINVIHFAGHYLALHEMSPAYEMTYDLKTLGHWKPSGKLLEMSPHVRFDPTTKELYLIQYSFEKPHLFCHILDRQGNVLKTIPVKVPYTSMMHDFILTKNYIILFDFGVIASEKTLMHGQGLFTWNKEHGARIGLLKRDGSETISWIETQPFFAYHFANGYEKGDEIFIDYVHYDAFYLEPDDLKQVPSTLKRLVINEKTKKASFHSFDQTLIEFPRIDTHYTSKHYRFIYTAGLTHSLPADSLADTYNAILKYDVEDEQIEIHDFGQSAYVSEPVFVPKPNAKEEDDGYLILFVYYGNEDRSDCVLLSAQHLAEEPIATIHLPQRVPSGLHGSWVIDNEILSSTH